MDTKDFAMMAALTGMKLPWERINRNGDKSYQITLEDSEGLPDFIHIAGCLKLIGCHTNSIHSYYEADKGKFRSHINVTCT